MVSICEKKKGKTSKFVDAKIKTGMREKRINSGEWRRKIKIKVFVPMKFSSREL